MPALTTPATIQITRYARTLTPGRWRAASLLTLFVTALVACLLAVPSGAMAAAPAARRQPAATTPATEDRHQEITVTVLPPVRQSGATAAPIGDARTVVAATVEPAAAGRVVRLQLWRDGGWHRITKDLTNRRGLVELFTRPREGARYRLEADPWRGLQRWHSEPVADTWGAPDFVDEFGGSALSGAWAHRIQFYNPWGGRACSKGDPSAVSVGGGVVRLSSMPDKAAPDLCHATDNQGDPLGRFPYRVNGHISTQHSADFLYGVAAARMRFPKSRGQHAAFWLQPRGLLDDGPTPWGAEIDVVEWYGATDTSQMMASAVHVPMPDGSKRQVGGRLRNPDRFLANRSDAWWSHYHVFSVEWTPTEYIFRVNGHEAWRTQAGVSDVPEFLILSMLSSDFELPAVGGDPTPRTAEVDWAAFWQAG